MATTKKTTTATKPTTTKAKAEPVKEVVEKPVIKEDIIAKAEKSYSPTDLINCQSVVPGLVCLDGPKSGIAYRWHMSGDVEGVEYQDLLMMLNQRSGYLTKPFIAIEDEELVAKYPYLKEVYDNLYSPQEIKDVILQLNAADLKATIENMPVGVKEAVKSAAATLIETGELDSISKIKAIDEIFGTNLKIMTEFKN